MANTFPSTNSPTATQLSRLETSGNTRENLSVVNNWNLPTPLSHADWSPRVFSMTLSNWRRREDTKFPFSPMKLHGLLISNTNSRTSKMPQMAKNGRTFSGTICKMSISSSGWEPQVFQISENFGVEFQEVLRLEITKYTSITSLKYHHSKERNISCYQQPMPWEVRITS